MISFVFNFCFHFFLKPKNLLITIFHFLALENRRKTKSYFLDFVNFGFQFNFFILEEFSCCSWVWKVLLNSLSHVLLLSIFEALQQRSLKTMPITNKTWKTYSPYESFSICSCLCDEKKVNKLEFIACLNV